MLSPGYVHALDYTNIYAQHTYVSICYLHVAWNKHMEAAWRLHETGTAKKMDSMIVEVDEDPCEALMYVASQTKDLARVEKRGVQPRALAVALVPAATLHGSFGALLKRYVSRMAACGLSRAASLCVCCTRPLS
jgi:hypothetical protein